MLSWKSYVGAPLTVVYIGFRSPDTPGLKGLRSDYRIRNRDPNTTGTVRLFANRNAEETPRTGTRKKLVPKSLDLRRFGRSMLRSHHPGRAKNEPCGRGCFTRSPATRRKRTDRVRTEVWTDRVSVTLSGEGLERCGGLGTGALVGTGARDLELVMVDNGAAGVQNLTQTSSLTGLELDWV